jgi:hypothetical protein
MCIDDFLSEGGKLWPWVKDIAEEVSRQPRRRAGVFPFCRQSPCPFQASVAIAFTLPDAKRCLAIFE